MSEPLARALGAASWGRTLLLAVPAAALVAAAGLLWSVTATISAEIGRELVEERVHLARVESLERAAATAHATVLRQWLADPGERAAQRDEIVEATQRLRRAMGELGQLAPLDDVERAAATRLLESAALLSNQLWQALSAVDPDAAAGELQLAVDALDAHARAVSAVTADAGSSTDARLALLRGRQVLAQVAFIAVALSILFLAAGLSRRQLRASEEMRRVQEEAARQRAQFFANMSHELRTPLVAIRGFAGMIGVEPSAGDPARDHAQQIEAQAHDLLGIINNILDSAKLESGRVELEVEDVDVGEVVERCVQRCRGLVGDKQVELTCEVPAGLRARADFVKLQQVLTNLLGNALKFTQRGSVSVRARAASGRVEIEVADTGIGIDAAALQQILGALPAGVRRHRSALRGHGAGPLDRARSGHEDGRRRARAVDGGERQHVHRHPAAGPGARVVSRSRGAALLAALVALGCERQAPRGAPLRETVHRIDVSGSAAQLPLLLEAANQYMRGNPGSLVMVSGDGSLEALRDLEAGTIAVAAADLPPGPGEAEGLVDSPVAAVPVAIFASRGPFNEAVRSLTREQLRDIVTGRITNWSAVGGGDQRLVFVDRGRTTGARAALASWLGTDSFLAGAPVEASAANAQATLLARPGALSYLALPYRHPQLRTLALEGVEPPGEGGRYPLWTREHLYLRADAGAPARAFVDFVRSPAFTANIVVPLGYLPLDRP